jgi:glucose/mannose-6-phosphate isomerase
MTAAKSEKLSGYSRNLLMFKLDEARIRRIDRGDFAVQIRQFPEQLEQGWRVADQVFLPKWRAGDFSNIVVSGMGGSAIAAELVGSMLNYRLKIPFQIVRHYLLPDSVNPRTLFIASSYSGNTEETLSAYRQARRKSAKMISICSGGKLAELSHKDKIAVIKIPGGLAPRSALGYSLTAILNVFSRLGFLKNAEREIFSSAKFLRQYQRKFLPEVHSSRNLAKMIAARLYQKIPIIYAGQDYFSAVALRWKQQVCENAKTLAFCHAFPEFNHNELVGWGKIEKIKGKLKVIILKDRVDHKKVKARMRIVSQMLKEKEVEVLGLESSGSTLFSRMLSLIHLGDWASYYLAILNQVDPLPVRIIDLLKQRLAKVK